MDLEKTYGTDKDLEKNGVWVEIDDGAQILVARTDNPRYRDMLRAELKPHKKKIQRGTLSQEFQEKLLMKVVAHTVLLDWKGITVKDKAVKYSPEKALELLEEYPDFREDVMEAANTMETFRREIEEEDRKN